MQFATLLSALLVASSGLLSVSAVPVVVDPSVVIRAPTQKGSKKQHVDLQGHRGARGEESEETLFAFARGILAGVETLEMDTGITKDGAVVVWHDENIAPEKCIDSPSQPGVVGQYIANLTLAQVKSLDCGSKRLADFPLQLTHPGAKIQTLEQVFDFAECAAPGIKYNIESKLSPPTPNTTASAKTFVSKLLPIYRSRKLISRVTFQSFAWETLILSKQQEPKLATAALISYDTVFAEGQLNGTEVSPWLGGVDVYAQKGPSVVEKIAQAAASIKADILSPSHNIDSGEVGDPGYMAFTNQTMVNEAHRLGLTVKPYTPNSLTTAEKLTLLDRVDGLITDYPSTFHAWLKQQGFKVPAPGDKARVERCLKKALAAQ